ncbi:MAG: leucine-rich repeat protein, partial [Clostridia bacterium]|nr:leucine-rich repeat protein [Clostridia bacterium]
MTSNLLNNAAEIDEEEIEEPTEVAPWSDYSDQIKRVVIEEGVTYVGTFAFMLCYNLESVVLADSVKEISYYAFAACFSLGSINLQMVEKIGYCAFMYAMELEAAVLESAVIISEGAFGYCVELKSVTFSDNLKSIGPQAFAGCVNISNIMIPESVEEIGDYVFDEVVALQKVENKSLTAVATEDLSFIVSCSEVDSAEKCAFIMAESMKVQMRADLLGESWTEESMINAILVKFNEKFDVSYTFEELVEYMNIQDTSGGVPSYFTVYCYESSAEHEQCKDSGIPHILFGESEQHICFDFMGVSGDLNWKIDLDTRTLTFSGSGRMADYSTYSDEAPWVALSSFYDCVEFAEDSTVTHIGDAAFNETKIKEISLPSTLVSIGGYAFRYCELESITIPASVSSIGYGAFSYNKKLKTVAFEENSAMTYFTSSLFDSCASLETVDIPAGVYSIDSSAFNGCDALKTLNIHPDNTNLLLEDSIIYNYDKSTIMLCLKNKAGAVVIPASVTTINSYCFNSCNLITSISFEENSNINYLSGFANYCDALETVTLPKSLTSIYDSFSSCDSLTAIKVEEGSSSLYSDDGVLYNYDKTTLLKYPAGRSGEYEVASGTTTISGSAFSDSQKLTKVILPEGLTSIGSSAFSYCEKLSDIVIPESVTSIGSYAFSYTALESVIIPVNVTRVEYNAFQRCADLKEITFNNKDCFIGSSAVPGETTIKGYTASTAEDYAIANGNEFVAIDDKVIESISIESLPNKTKYSVGSSFEADGLAIKINFNDGTSIIKSENLNVTGFNSAKPGLCTLTVEYAGYKVTFDVEIYEINSEILLGETIELKLDVGDTAYIKFVPEFSGEFPLEIGLSDYDSSYIYSHSLRVAICDEGKNQIGGSTYVYPYTNVESVTYSLQKDKTYYFTVQYNYGGNGTGFDITLKCGHSITTNHEEVPATCTSTGFTAGVFCENCKQWLSGHEVIDYKHTDENKDFICDLCNADAKQLLVSGNCGYDGDNIKWYLYDSGLLELIGTGKMQNYSGSSPWLNYTDSMHNPESIDIDIKRVTFSDGITNVGAYAFNSLYTVEELTLPDSIISIDDYAFSHCSGFFEIKLPANIQSIEASAFKYCSNLLSVRMPVSLTTVSDGAFYSCDALSVVFYKGTEEDWNKISISGNNDPLNNAKKIYSSNTEEVIVVEEGECNENIHWTVYSDGALVLEGSGDMPDYSYSNIPWNKYSRSVRKVTVSEGITSIASHAFYNFINLKEVSIPQSVAKINDGAFYNCDKIIEITIQGDITSLGNEVFYSCDSLKKVIFSGTVDSIGSFAFSECTGLTEFNLPASVQNIGRYAFYRCSELTEIDIPDGVVNLNEYTFSGCYSLVSITLPESLEKIGAGAFASCSSLEEIYIPENVSSIASGLFYNCSSLQKITVDSKNDYYCDENGVLFNKDKTTVMAFPQKHSATTYTVPDGVTYIDTYAFSECSNLTEIVIPDSAQSVGSSAFYYCRNIKKVSVPANLSYYNDAFYSCSNISEIVIRKGNGKMTDFNTSTYRYTPWYVSRDEGLTITLENGITNIGEYAFRNNKFSTIAIPDSVTEIGYGAFYNCSKLTSVTIPDSVTTIGESAFYNCNNLSKVSVPANVSYNYDAFYECNYISEIVIRKGNDKMPDLSSSFNYTPWYTSGYNYPSITLENGITNIGAYAFYYNTLSTIIIPDTVTEIGDYAFSGCSNLNEITIPDTVTEIGDYAFSGCSNLNEITIPEAVTKVGENAFVYCGSLKNINVEEGNSNYVSENGVLYNKDKTILICFPSQNSQSEFTIPDSVTTIGDYAFSSCTSLTSVAIPDSVTAIGEYAFYYCIGLTSITIPDSITTIGNG